MGFLGGLTGELGNLLGGSPNGASFQAQGTNILHPTTVGQAQQAYSGSQAAIAQQQALASALQSQGQMGMNSQAQLAQALQAQAMGQGPNPAQAQLAQATGQGALMAGQRGAASNVGLIARQAGQQGAGIQQQAAGQAATLGAQQQLAAQSQLQNLAASQLGQQSGAVGSLNQYQQGEQGQILGGINAQNNANVSMQSNINNANAGMAQTNANNSGKALGGLLSAAGGIGGMLVGGPAGAAVASKLTGSASGSAGSPAAYFYDGGEVPEHLNAMHAIYHGGNYEHKQTPKLDQVPQADRFKGGGEVAGKPKMMGDHPENDTVKAKLSPGEIVIPNHITQAKNAPELAAKFVAEQLQKSGKYSDDEKDDFKSALKDAIKARKK
jgi:hypothetical protein